MTDFECEVCGKPYKLFMYPRPGPAPGMRYVPDCDCVTEFDKKMEKERERLMKSYKKWKKTQSSGGSAK